MTKFFPDEINDLIFHKPTKRFTDEEKLIIDNLINIILREDKKSIITESRTAKTNFKSDFPFDLNKNTYITEIISKGFNFKGKPFDIRFCKSYPERAFGPDGKRIQIIAASKTFYDEIESDYTVTVDVEYDKNNHLTLDAKKKIENDFCKVIIKLINKTL